MCINMKILVAVLCLSLGLVLVTSNIIDGAAYYIQNAGDNLCVVAGHVGERISGTLMTNGTAISRPCQDIREHQWIVHYKKGNYKEFGLSSGAVHKLHFEKPLNVNIAGDFVHYFRNLVSTSLVDEKNDKPSYLIKDADSNDCYLSHGVNKSLSLSACNATDASQAWNFNLVQESKAPGLNCTSFWNCT